jgi:hypothetical protein
MGLLRATKEGSSMKGPIVVLVLALVFCPPGAAQAAVLTFDDLTGLGGPMPSGYGGLDWNLYWIDVANYYNNPSGYQNGMVSPSTALANIYTTPITSSISSVDPFTFNGAYLTAAWNDGMSITVTGSLGGTKLYERTVVVDTSGPTYFVFDFKNIDNVYLHSFGGTHHEGFKGYGAYFAMDDFTYNEPVPEPAAIALLAFSLILFFRTGSRREGCS